MIYKVVVLIYVFNEKKFVEILYSKRYESIWLIMLKIVYDFSMIKIVKMFINYIFKEFICIFVNFLIEKMVS